jgi:hypothetical protein
MATEVFLHVGPPKTGTSYLQAILWANRETLRQAGLLLPGTRKRQRHAVTDVHGSAERAGIDPDRVRGSWQALRDEIHAWPDRALITRETLCAMGSDPIGRMVRDLAPADVHVILTVRDLARSIPAYWQQAVKVGKAEALDPYVRSIIDRTPEARRFQWAQFPEVVAARWAAHVPRDRIHIVTLPPPGSPPGTLWERFAGLLGIDDLVLPESGPVNPSLGAVETELLRLTNAKLTPRLQGRQRVYWTRERLANNILGRRDGERFGLPPHAHEWVVQRAEQTVRELRTAGYDVRGDLADLIPSAAAKPARSLDEITDAELLEAATGTIAELVLQLRDTTFAARRARARRRRSGPPRAPGHAGRQGRAKAQRRSAPQALGRSSRRGIVKALRRGRRRTLSRRRNGSRR